MWRNQTLRKGRQILSLTQKHLATEAGNAAPTPPPTPKPRGGFGVFKFLGLSLPLATGGLLGYAWYDNDFRKQLEDNVPYSKEILETVLPQSEPSVQKKEPPKPTMKPAIPSPIWESRKETKSDSSSVLPGSLIASAYCLSDKDELPEDVKSSPNDNTSNLENVNPHPDSVNNNGADLGNKDLDNNSKASLKDIVNCNYQLQTNVGGSVQQGGENETKKEELTMEQKLRNKELEDKADNAALEVVIDKLLQSGQNWVTEAAKAQVHVAKATKNHSSLLKKAMDETSNILDKDSEWEAVTVAFKERDNTVARANELVDEARKTIEKLKKVLDEAKSNKVTMKNQAIFTATKKLSDFSKEMSVAGSQVRQADAEAKVMLKYKDLVDKGRKQFQEELDSLLPDIKRGRNSRKLSEEELNALIAHAHRRIEQLQKQIAEHLAMEQKRLAVALDEQKKENKSLTESAVGDERAHLFAEFEMERQKMEIEFSAWMEADVRKQLGRQAAAHSDHLRDVLAVQEDQLNKDYERKMNIKLLEEREKFQTETTGWISRLKGIEAAVDARAASEKLAHTAQDLWLACIALNSTIQFGDDTEDKPIPLQQQVDTVIKSADRHPFVETVVKTIPQTALERGIYTENELRDRFVRVSQISRRLGLVEESDASLYKYLVSFLHSFFTVSNVAAYSEKDLVSLDEMDNFKLVANAQYWMEKGNLDMAVRFMCQLNGQSKVAAGDWIAEAKLLLETRQAAKTILSFASATGLAATF